MKRVVKPDYAKWMLDDPRVDGADEPRIADRCCEPSAADSQRCCERSTVMVAAPKTPCRA